MTTNLCIPARVALASALAAVTVGYARADLITNGGFESGFAGWTRADQVGSTGSYFIQSGPSSPVNGLPVQAPPQGVQAAMTDAAGPGSHVLYQDFAVPASVPQATVQFLLLINNTATAFTTPTTLDFSTPALNQQARVDLMTTAADPFSVAAADILQNLFQTAVGSPLTTPYTAFSIDITAVLAAHAGGTVRLRFAETDNVNIFNLGVDGVSVAVPEPAGALVGVALVGLRRRRRR